MLEKPVIGFLDVEYPCQSAMGSFRNPVVTQQAVFVVLLQVSYYLPGLVHADSSVCRAMDYPQGKFSQSVVALKVTASAQRHRGRYLVRIGTYEIHCPIASHAHSQDVYSGSVYGIILHDPVHQPLDLIRSPSVSRGLRRKYDCRHIFPLLYRIQDSVFENPVQVVA